MDLSHKDWLYINSDGIKKSCPICKVQPKQKCKNVKTGIKMKVCHPVRSDFFLQRDLPLALDTSFDLSTSPTETDWRAYLYSRGMSG